MLISPLPLWLPVPIFGNSNPPFWFACFSLPDGRRTQRSTKLMDRRDAMRLAMQWEDAAMLRITETQARRVLSDIHEQIHGARLATPSVTDFTAQ